MNEMVERVARAMYEDEARGVVSGWHGLLYQDVWRGRARSAIAAMREPTEAMTTSGADKVWEFSPDYAPPTGHSENPESGEGVAKETWRAMIDVALKD